MDFDFDTGTIFGGLATLDVTTLPPLGSGPANVLDIIANGAVILPKGTPALRPGANGGTDIAGMFRYNTTATQLEYYDGTTWNQLTSTAGTVSSFQTSLAGLTPSTATTGAITLAGTLGATSGGTGATVAPTAGQFLYSSGGTTYSATSLGTVAVSSFSAGTTGFTPNSATQGAVTLAGNLNMSNGGTGASLTAVAGAPVYSTGSALAIGTAGTTGQVYISGGTGAPTWLDKASTITTSQILQGNGSGAFTANGGTFVGSGTYSGVTLSGTVTNGTDATTKDYVDALLTGLSWKQAVKGSSTTALTATYANGTGGVGATLTNAGTQAAFTVDGVTFTGSGTERVLIKNQANTYENGIYIVTTLGSGSTNWVLTRALDNNTPEELDGAAVYVQQGSTLADTGWTQTQTMTAIGVGNPIVWSQFSGSGAYTAGNGLTLTGNQFSLTSPVSLTNGGTNNSTSASNGSIMYNNGTAIVNSTVGTSGQILTSGGAGAPTWTTLSGAAVTSFSAGTTGFTPNTATTGAVTLAGILNPANGGTGLNTSTATNGQILIGNGTGLSLSTITQGTGITITNGSGTITIANAGVTSIAFGTTGLTPSAATTGAVSVAGTLVVANGGTGVTSLTTNGVLYGGATVGVTAAGTTGQVLTGNTGSAPTWTTLSGAAVTSFQTSLSGLTPSSATTGAVTLAGTLGATSGGTGATVAPTAGQFLYSAAGTTYAATTLSGIAVTTFSGGTTGLTPNSATSGAITLGGILELDNGGTNANLTAVNGGIVYSTATAMAITAAGTTGQVLVSNGAAAPTWNSASTILALYRENPSTPTTPSATGTNAVAIGTNSTASGTSTFGVGDGSNASIFGSKAFANGEFATAGDAQAGLYVLRRITTDAVSTAMFLDGQTATQRLVLPNNSAWTFDILIIGRRTDAVGGGASYRFVGAIRKDATAGSITFIGTPSKTVIGETTVALDAAVTANTTDGDLRVSVTGLGSQTWRWVATVRTTEVTN